MLYELNDYDWEEAFKYVRYSQRIITEEHNKNLSILPYDREDVAKIHHIYNGSNDKENWIGVFELKDGRFARLVAGCDYTGWD